MCSFSEAAICSAAAEASRMVSARLLIPSPVRPVRLGPVVDDLGALLASSDGGRRRVADVGEDGCSTWAVAAFEYWDSR